MKSKQSDILTQIRDLVSLLIKENTQLKESAIKYQKLTFNLARHTEMENDPIRKESLLKILKGERDKIKIPTYYGSPSKNF